MLLNRKILCGLENLLLVHSVNVLGAIHLQNLFPSIVSDQGSLGQASAFIYLVFLTIELPDQNRIIPSFG